MLLDRVILSIWSTLYSKTHANELRPFLAPAMSPEKQPELHAPLPMGNYPYRLEHPPNQVFDLDLDLNPDI